MRIFRLLILFFLTCPFLAVAQESNISGHFGIKAGPSVTTLRVSGITPNSPRRKFDYHLGGMYRLRLNQFVIQPEVLISLKGGTFVTERVGGRQTTRNNFNYLSVPVMFGYIPTEGITLQLGPEFSYAFDTPNGPGRKQDIGLAVGAHYDFLDMLDKFSLQLRYIYGLKNVAPPSDPALNVDYRNRVLQLSIVYNFYKKK
ncbi:porin family protein [Rudanella lutea]|uniref:porin family protein n=1 Tax=Rudanella lutea TaxID=451374 RepID=UPI0003716B0E|nr:porin family protein [Rudanella lutea]